MRLRRKPWVDEAIHEFDAFVISKDQEIGEEKKGQWSEIFGRKAPLHVELGTGKGDFITQLAERNPEINYIGIEAQQDVLCSNISMSERLRFFHRPLHDAFGSWRIIWIIRGIFRFL